MSPPLVLNAAAAYELGSRSSAMEAAGVRADESRCDLVIRILKRAVSTSRYYFVEERWTTNYMALVRYYATLESERGDAAASAAVELLSMIESEGFGDGVPPLQALLWCRESPRMRTARAPRRDVNRRR